MGKYTSILVFLVLIPLVLMAGNSSVPVVLKVGVYDNPPKIFVDKKGKPDGIFIDIIESVYSPRKVRVEYVSGKWSDLFRMLQKGEIDVLPDMAFSPERDSLFHLSVPVLSSWLQVYTSSSSIINQPADLQGKRIGVLRSSNQEEYVREVIKRDFNVDYKVITFDTYTQSVDALKNNEIDALIADRFFYFSELCDEEILATGVVIQVSALHFAFSSQSSFWLVDVLNKDISLQYNNPKSVYYQSLQKWFNKHKTKIPKSVQWLIALLAMAFVVFLLFTVTLRTRVKSKTRELYLQNNELIKAKEKAEESDRLKTAFLQNLSHEIRTPLNGILGFVNVLQDLHFNDERKNQFTEIINSSSDRLLSTINDIVEISKIDAHQVEVNRTLLNLMDILEKQIGQLNDKAAKKGLTLTLNHQLTSENASIEADAALLNGIISRLLNNALKFTSEGCIELGAYPEGSYRIVFVKDTGMGIPADRLEAIFDRFVNADLKLSRSYDGSGLGLAIVKSYLELMNGSSWVESEVGKGSTFYFKLPVS